jgi:acyl carrier protein
VIEETLPSAGTASAAPVERLRAWLLSRCPDDAVFDDDTDLGEGIVEDSLAFVELLVLVEDLRGAPIASADIELENFRTLRTIARRFFDIGQGGR